MRSPAIRRALALVVLAAVVAITAACSGGDDGASDDSTTTTATEAEGTAPTTTAVPLERGEQLYVYIPEPGDCWEPRRTDESSEGGAGQQIILQLPCDLPHANETFGVVEVPDDSFPGDGALRELGQQECPQHFEAYVGTPYELSIYEMGVWAPSQVDWNQTYSHFLACYLYLPDGTKPTEPLRGTAR